MNALFNAIKDRGNIALANDGRLLKKSFFGLIILACAFQPGEFGIIIRESIGIPKSSYKVELRIRG